MDEEESATNSHRSYIRRHTRRQPNQRSTPYNSNSSNLRRRRQRASVNSHSNELNTSLRNDQNENEVNNEMFFDETFDDEDNRDDFQVLVDLSHSSPIDLTIADENHHHQQQQADSSHSLSTIDFDPDDDHQYYYRSSSRPIYDYSTSNEPIVVHQTDPIDVIQHNTEINNNFNDDEDLSIEIILESSQNNTLETIARRRLSILSSNHHHHGLRLSEILNIPQKLYSSIKSQINDKYPLNTQCYICLEDFQLVDTIKILLCQHIYHTACINEWLRTHSYCAYCRTYVTVEDMSWTNIPTAAGRRQRTRPRRSLLRSATNSTTLEEQQQQQQQQQP